MAVGLIRGMRRCPLRATRLQHRDLCAGRPNAPTARPWRSGLRSGADLGQPCPHPISGTPVWQARAPWRQGCGVFATLVCLLLCVGDPMFKYLPLPNPILQKWRIWLKDQFVGDVPPEDAFCEFECEKSECKLGHWETCKRRLSYLELGKANSGDKSPTKAE